MGPHATDRPLYLPTVPLSRASASSSRSVRRPTAVANSWAAPTSTPPPPLDNGVTMPSSALDLAKVWSNPIHAEAVNQRIAACLRDDLDNPERGRHHAAVFMSCVSNPVVHGGASNEAVLETTTLVPPPPSGNPFPSPLPSPPDSPPSTPPESEEAAAAAADTGATPSPDAAAAAALLTAAALEGSNLSRTRVRAFIKASLKLKAEREAALASSGAPASAPSAAPAAASDPSSSAPGTPSSTTYQRYVRTPRPASSSPYTELADANKSIAELTDYIDVCREAIHDLRRQHTAEMAERAKKAEEVVRPCAYVNEPSPPSG